MRMNQICEMNRCTGCAACVSICPHNAVSLIENELGFKYPQIDNYECINCGLCEKTCPQNHEINDTNEIKKIYAAYSKDKGIRKNSSSGGVFSEIATKIISLGGVVYATKMSDDCKSAFFAECTKIEDLKSFRGSKYLQSDVGSIYKDIKYTLDKSGKKVMFVGTGCQVAGLRAYLKKNYDNLLCVDIICHGVPSPKLWRKHISGVESELNIVAKSVNFRYKKPSWTEFSLLIEGKDGKKYIKSKFDDQYLIGFLTELTLRPNCYTCPYASISRTGDVTLADFWGYKSTEYKMRNTEKGISLVLINTEKGQKVFDSIEDRIMVTEKKLKEAMSGNRSLKEPWKKNPKSDEFWKEFVNNDNLIEVYST